MSKTTKSEAKKTRASSPKRKAKPVEPVTPQYVPENASVVMALHDVIKVFKMIASHDKLTAFTRIVKNRGAEVRIPAQTVNLVKDFVATKGLHTNAVGKQIVNARKKRLANTIFRSASVTAAATEDGDPNQCVMGRVERG
ncbi:MULTISPECIES: hypothetical protein [unclassified Bradyrhizobium]|uniref:hypothetical protein n=1 Tax=unclassified Bradyrhizobium TaxID=2631580 RepID=UPI001FFAF649|nr:MULTISPECIES: hypothetical protein [unclassified Bradyrhizobium]MCK1412371.1 hypothetical protein [Bradyrhizobium sp. CW4]UPJ26532.1 hypothetical protein IVB54_33480 [Bradyrhizobium sp. CW1]